MLLAPGNGTWPIASRILGSEIQAQENAQSGPVAIVLRLEDRVVLIESDVEDVAASRAHSLGTFDGLDELFGTEVRLPNELAKADLISLASDPVVDGSYVGLIHPGIERDQQVAWYRFSHAGEISDQERYEDDVTLDVAQSGIEFAALVPPAAIAIVAIETGDLSFARQLLADSLAGPAETAWTVILCLVQPILGILLAIWCAQRRGLDKQQTRSWIRWALLLGPCGSLAMLAVFPRVERDPCPSCQRSTNIDHARCQHCGSSLDDTPRMGIEIFDQDHPTSASAAEPARV